MCASRDRVTIVTNFQLDLYVLHLYTLHKNLNNINAALEQNHRSTICLEHLKQLRLVLSLHQDYYFFSKQRLLILNPFPVARRVQQAREQAPEQHVRGRHAEAPCRAGARRLLLLLLRRVAWNGRRWLVLSSYQINVHELALLLLHSRRQRWHRSRGGGGCWLRHHPPISSRTKKCSAIVVREREFVDGFSYVTYLPVLLSIKPSSPRRRGDSLALRFRPRLELPEAGCRVKRGRRSRLFLVDFEFGHSQIDS